jgi:hypothetical protein
MSRIPNTGYKFSIFYSFIYTKLRSAFIFVRIRIQRFSEVSCSKFESSAGIFLQNKKACAIIFDFSTLLNDCFKWIFLNLSDLLDPDWIDVQNVDPDSDPEA